jgi:SP family general alpha glucoside:H+ symporter-like MFS transporter
MNRFGILAKDGTYQIPPDWQNGISGARNVGEIIGLQVKHPHSES